MVLAEERILNDAHTQFHSREPEISPLRRRSSNRHRTMLGSRLTLAKAH